MNANILKSAAIAAFAIFGTLGVALAEVPAPPSPEQLGALIHPRGGPSVARAPEGTGTGHLTNTKLGVATTPSLVSGWNTEFCYTALWYNDGTYHYIFGFNSDGSYLYAYSSGSSLTSLQATLLNACGSGSYYHVYLNASGGIVYLENR